MQELRAPVADREVSALLRPADGEHRATLTFGHGAGADMRHSSMAAIAEAFAGVGIATLRYNFPFKEDGRNRVDAQAVSTDTVAAALECARQHAEGPYLLGGHSFGGRMGFARRRGPRPRPRRPHLLFVSAAHAQKNPPPTCGAPGQHQRPHAVLSGTRDGMAEPDLLNQVAARVDATVNWLDTADHGYKVLKRTRTRTDDVFEEMAGYASAWLASL